MAILYAAEADEAAQWTASLKALDPSLDIRFWPEWGDPTSISFIIVGGRSPGDLSIFPRLKAVQSTWAGVNHLLRSQGLPKGVPIARMVDRGLTSSMTEYIIYQVLDEWRNGPELRLAQHAFRWSKTNSRAAKECRIGILGLGTLGADIAQKLYGLGFSVRGWSRSTKDLGPHIQSFAQAESLPAFLCDLHILICLLPLTEETENILDAKLFAHLPNGSVLMNVGRGAQLNEDDLLAALGSGKIRRAVLDVFREEPLPATHLFWRHPQITLTPHVAAITRAGTGAEDILENYQRALDGQPLLNQVDIGKGY